VEIPSLRLWVLGFDGKNDFQHRRLRCATFPHRVELVADGRIHTVTAVLRGGVCGLELGDLSGDLRFVEDDRLALLVGRVSSTVDTDYYRVDVPNCLIPHNYPAISISVTVDTCSISAVATRFPINIVPALHLICILYTVAEVVAGESKQVNEMGMVESIPAAKNTALPEKVCIVVGLRRLVAPRKRFSTITDPAPAARDTVTSTLFEAELGVIVAVSPVTSTKDVDELLNDVSFTVCTTCTTLPAGSRAAATVPVSCVATMLLFVSVCVAARPTKVSVPVGSVSVPLFTMVAMTGLVSVLFVSVSVVVLPTSVSVATGSVRTLEPDTAGALIVTEPDVSPATKMLAILYPYLRVQCGDLRGLRVDDTLEFLNGGGQRRD